MVRISAAKVYRGSSSEQEWKKNETMVETDYADGEYRLDEGLSDVAMDGGHASDAEQGRHAAL